MVGKNLSTIAVISASNNVPLHNFTFELGLAIADIGTAYLYSFSYLFQNPANIYLFKVNNRNTRKRCEIWSKLTVKATESH